MRNVLPNGERRAAIIHRTLGDDAEAFGLEVPVSEAGVHDIIVQVAKRDTDGELVEVGSLELFGPNIMQGLFACPASLSEFYIAKPSFTNPLTCVSQVFRSEGHKVHVSAIPPKVLAECKGIQLVAVDVPRHVEGSMRAFVSVRRLCQSAPKNLALLIRNSVPDGNVRATVSRKVMADVGDMSIGIEVPLGEAGQHIMQVSIAEELEDGTFEVLLQLPDFEVLASNPPPPKIMEDERRSLVCTHKVLASQHHAVFLAALSSQC